MTPKADNQLIAARVAYEREWAYERWLGRYSFSQMRAMANAPESEGGLGYDLSLEALKGLVQAAREARGDLAMKREERIERQGAEVDERARAARQDMSAAYQRARQLDEAIDSWHPHDYDSMAEARAALAKLVAQRTDVAADLERADRRLDAAHGRESKLFGLDAPTEAKLEVTNRDAVVDELNAMLERGHKKGNRAEEPSR